MKKTVKNGKKKTVKKVKKQKIWVIHIFCRDDFFSTVEGAYKTDTAAKKAMKKYSDQKSAEKNGTTYYSEDEMKLVELEILG